MASDRSIGGFGHTWGEDQPNVQRKRRLLEAEGIVFERDGARNKIRKDHFVEEAVPNQSTVPTKSDAAAASKRSNRSKREDAPRPQSTEKKKMKRSKYFDADDNTVSEKTLRREILSLLQKRKPGKTC